MASRNEKIIIGLGAAALIIYLLGKGKGGGTGGGGGTQQPGATITDVTIQGG
jgi:hypothetical protein